MFEARCRLWALPTVLLLVTHARVCKSLSDASSHSSSPPLYAGATSLTACEACVTWSSSPERACGAVCKAVLRPEGAGVSSPAPRLRQVSHSSAPPSENMHCVPMEECPAYRHSVSSMCGCCGLQFGIQYPLPPTLGAYGNLSAFKSLQGCRDEVTASNCDTCLLWRKLRGTYTQGPLTSLSCEESGLCFQVVGGQHTLMATSSGEQGKDPGHWLLLPGSKTSDWSVYGLEDPMTMTPQGERIWDTAWWCAFDPYRRCLPSSLPGSVLHLPSASDSASIGLALNPATSRSMHQLHIHISPIPKPLRAAFTGKADRFATWQTVTLQLTGGAVLGENVTLHARYYSLLATDSASPSTTKIEDTPPQLRPHHNKQQASLFSERRNVSSLLPFFKTFAFAGFDPLKTMAWGMLMLPSEEARGNDTSPEGVYLLVGAQHKSKDTHVQWWNDYPDNPYMMPEHLLCNEASIEAGIWRQQDCEFI